MNCNPPGASVHGILQARILEWVAIFFSGGSSWRRDQTQVSHIAGGLLTNWATREEIANKDLLYSTENFTQCSVMTYMGKKSKKEWKILYINTYMESRKMVLTNLFTGQQWRCRNKQTCGHSWGERRWMTWDSGTETYTLCKVGKQWECAVWCREHKAGALR